MSSYLQSFRSKILALVAVAIVGMALLATLSIWQMRQQLIEGRQGQLVTAVQSAHTIVEGFRAQAAAGQMSVADAQKAAQDALRHSRYGADGKDYFYIWSTEGVGVMHPIKPEWVGRNMIGQVKDGHGVDIIRALTDGLRNSPDGRAFVMTNFPRPGEKTPVPKLQYVIRVDGWNWMVGSGLYTDDLNAMVMRALLGDLALGLVALLAVGGFGGFVLR
ncbi:MAG: cache domain-containing protein, partial [Hydrogenophaga sp.]|uniref:cache domain-containing protein n=1 Tax=Hydrogenophaga sp. TaxID=1904254 RepID=UPI003D9B7407